MQALASVCTELTGISNESEALTQQYLTVLLKSLGKAQWNALLSLANASPKNQRMASLQAPLRDVVEFALQLWVSGMAGSTEVVTYVGAPIWSVLTFTKPPGICGGALGYWSERPIWWRTFSPALRPFSHLKKRHHEQVSGERSDG